MAKETISDKLKTSRRTGLLLGILAAAVVLLLQQYPFMKQIFASYENRLLDYRISYRAKSPRSKLDERVQLVAITDEFLNRETKDTEAIRNRRVYYEIFDFLSALDTRMVLFDVVFLQEREWDDMLALSWEENQNAYLAYWFILEGHVSEEVPETLEILSKFSLPYDPEMGGRPLVARGVGLPSKTLLSTAKGAGFINIKPDPEDGVIRHMPMLIMLHERLYPSLALIAICDFYRVPVQDIDVKFGKRIRIPLPGNTWTDIPIDDEGKLLISYHEGETFIERAVPYVKILEMADEHNAHPSLSNTYKSLFQNKIILVGVVATGATDIVSIPLQPRFPAIGIHANVISSILKKSYLRTISLLWNIAILLLVGFFSGLVISRLSYVKGLFLLLGCMLCYFIFAFIIFLNTSVVIPIVSPLVTFIVSYFFVAVYLLLAQEKESKRVKNIFGQFAAPVVVREILKNYDNPALWGHRQKITLLYSDIRRFTTISEQLASEEVVDLLDRYYGIIEQAVFGNNGVINKFMGDGVLVLYGAPYATETPEADAVRTALTIQKNADELKSVPFSEKFDNIGIGIGIHSGETIIGIVGKGKRSEYTALGDAVNTVERIQGIAGVGDIVISGVVKEALSTPDQQISSFISYEALPPVELKGKAHLLDLYRIEIG